MQSSLSSVHLFSHSENVENINKAENSDHHQEFSRNLTNLDFLRSLIWPPFHCHRSSTIDFQPCIVSKEEEEEVTDLSPLRRMSGVCVYRCPHDRRGINGRPTACNVTISTSWIIRTTVEDVDCERQLSVRSKCGGHFAKCHQQNPTEEEFECIRDCVVRLEASGWYYGQLSWQEATGLLRTTPVGTFLIRDSSDPAYLYALSVQTECGPTSIRIHYADGRFKLDAEDRIAGRMPLFDCVVKLVNYYIQMSRTNKLSGVNHVWLDESGRRDRVIIINRPLCHRVQPLQHLCRLIVNEQLKRHRISEIQLPKALKTFLNDYPYSR